MHLTSISTLNLLRLLSLRQPQAPFASDTSSFIFMGLKIDIACFAAKLILFNLLVIINVTENVTFRTVFYHSQIFCLTRYSGSDRDPKSLISILPSN